jgi:hypothetical protein
MRQRNMKENEVFEGILISLIFRKEKNIQQKMLNLLCQGYCGKGWKNISSEKYCISSCNTSYLICLTAGVYVQQSTMILVHHPLHSTRSIGNSQTISDYNNHQAIESGRVPPHNCQSQKDGSEPVGFLFSGEFSPDSNFNN